MSSRCSCCSLSYAWCRLIGWAEEGRVLFTPELKWGGWAVVDCRAIAVVLNSRWRGACHEGTMVVPPRSSTCFVASLRADVATCDHIRRGWRGKCLGQRYDSLEETISYTFSVWTPCNISNCWSPAAVMKTLHVDVRAAVHTTHTHVEQGSTRVLIGQRVIVGVNSFSLSSGMPRNYYKLQYRARTTFPSTPV